MTKQIFPLALGGLAIGTTEFIIMGLLPDVAKDLGVSIPIANPPKARGNICFVIDYLPKIQFLKQKAVGIQS